MAKLEAVTVSVGDELQMAYRVGLEESGYVIVKGVGDDNCRVGHVEVGHIIYRSDIGCRIIKPGADIIGREDLATEPFQKHWGLDEIIAALEQGYHLSYGTEGSAHFRWEKDWITSQYGKGLTLHPINK